MSKITHTSCLSTKNVLEMCLLALSFLICYSGLSFVHGSDEAIKPEQIDPIRLELMKSPLNRTINDFSLKLLQQLIRNDENQCNIFFSPFSVMLMFSMLLHGTEGETRQQILKSFGYLDHPNLSVNEIHQSFQDLLYEISKKQRNYTLNIGSAGLFKEGLNPTRHFRTKLFEDYNAVIMNLNFKNQKQAAQTLNNWIRTITSNKVAKLENTQMNAKTNFVLLNAIYFSGKWKYPFVTLSKHHTFYNQIKLNNASDSNQNLIRERKDGSLEDKLLELSDKEERKYFNLTGDQLSNDNVLFKPSKVEMMGTLKMLNYVKSDDNEFELIELPYEGDLSMFIVLPNYQIKMQYVLSKLTSTYLNSLIHKMDKEKLRLMMPKFKIEQKLDLKHSLRKLGLTDLFDENSNFSKMFATQTLNETLYINQAIHNAYVDVDEKGTSAYGSTSLKSLVVSGLKEIIVQINRPFIFFIKDTIRDVTLFTGSLCRFI